MDSDGETKYPLRRLRDVGVALFDCDHATPKPAPAGYPYIAIPNIRDGHLDLTGARLISQSDLNTWTRKTKPRAGDVIVTRRARVGDIAVVPPDLRCAIGQNLVILRSDATIVDQGFLRWALRGPLYLQQVAKFLNVGAVFDSLNCADIPKFEIPVPPIPEQRAIAAILGALDDKIELNRRMNQTLEAIAQALFKSWFVDFDPVRSRMEGRRPAGMDAATAALFPDSFEDSALGELPAGWQVKPLDEVAVFLNGLALQNYPSDTNDYLPVIKIAELRRGITDSTDRATATLDPKYVVSDGDVLFSWSGSLEVVLWTGGRGALNQHLFKVTSTQFPKWFYYLWTTAHLPEFQRIAAGKATTMGHIQRYHLAAALVLAPPSRTLQAMTRWIEPFLDRLISNNIESRTLATVRDALLPKLLSGEIRAKEAQPIAEAAL